MKKNFFSMLMLLTFGVCSISFSDPMTGSNSGGGDNGAGRLQQVLNVSSRPNTGAAAYNEITSYYNTICGANCNYNNLASKFENVQQTLDSQINRNFYGTHQIPYNSRNPYNGIEGDNGSHALVVDSNGKTHDKQVAIDGTDHLGLIKYMYNIAGVNTSGMSSQTIDTLAQSTSQVYNYGTPVKTGDIIVMNYGNDSTIDSIGLVYRDNNGQMMMLEMGANTLENEGSSVKSQIPFSGAGGTVYVVPFETIMKTAYTNPTGDQDIKNQIQNNLLESGKTLTIPDNSKRITNLATSRVAGPVSNNGYTTSVNTPGTNGQEFLDKLTGATASLYKVLGKGQVKFSQMMVVLIFIGIAIDTAWSVLKSGFTGDVIEIYQFIFTKFLTRLPYLIFAVIYPVMMRDIVMPLFLDILPTYLFGDLIHSFGVGMANGKYVTYTDLIAYVFRKGIKLLGLFAGGGLLNQQQAVSGITGFLTNTYLQISPEARFSDIQGFAMSLIQGLGLLQKIINFILQVFVFRPMSAFTGIIILLCMVGIALNLFTCVLTFMISTSVGMFYLFCGTMDIFKSKAMNTFSIMISGILQYCSTMLFVFVFAEAFKFLGDKVVEVIMTPTNFMNLLPLNICIMILAVLAQQLGKNIYSNF